MDNRTDFPNRKVDCKLNIINKGNCLFIIELGLLILICVLHSVSAGHYADFFPINGTFQNYNPVRRLLSGQVPYKDFQDYLGIGHLYAGSLMTVVFGGDYRSSLQAFSFLTFGGLALISLMISLAIVKKKEIACAVTNVFLVILLVEPLIFKYGFGDINDTLSALEYALGTGNSARFIRGMILPISCFFVFLGYRVYKRFLAAKSLKNRELLLYLEIGTVAGFSFAWSNDYGVSCWVCLMIMAFWLSICRERKADKSALALLVSVLASLISLFVSIEIFTFGNFKEWCSATFATGGYQGWYYNLDKSYYVYDVDYSLIMMFQLGVVIAYLVKLYREKGAMAAFRRYGIPAFANMVSYCAVNEYKLLSGGSSREVALSVLFLTVLFEMGLFLLKAVNRKKLYKYLMISSLTLGLIWAVLSIKEELKFKFDTEKEGVFIEALGGSLTKLGEDIIEADKFLNGEEFFATYASAQEVVNHSFQPSGTDYIIHALGDSYREKYLNEFENGDFKYVATIREEYTDWEYWIKTANWYFYRELYENWHPVYENTYEMYWAHNDENEHNRIDSGYDISVVDVDDYQKKIIVQCEKRINGTADVYVDYSVEKTDDISSLLNFRNVLRVENTGKVYAREGALYESNYLRAKSKEFIPISVVNGYGEITLTSNPVSNTYLILNQAECNCIYTADSDYVLLQGIQSENNCFIVKHNDKNKNVVKEITMVRFGEKEYGVLRIETSEEGIRIYVDEKIEEDIEPVNVLYLQRKETAKKDMQNGV